jgi:hypothetical protein
MSSIHGRHSHEKLLCLLITNRSSVHEGQQGCILPRKAQVSPKASPKVTLFKMLPIQYSYAQESNFTRCFRWDKLRSNHPWGQKLVGLEAWTCQRSRELRYPGGQSCVSQRCSGRMLMQPHSSCACRLLALGHRERGSEQMCSLPQEGF